MAKSASNKKSPARPAGDLSIAEIKAITDKLVVLRKKILGTGATVLKPTPEWDKLRREIALLNKNLNADTAAKSAASKNPKSVSDPA